MLRVRDLERSTNQHYQAVLLDAPTIEFNLDLQGLEPQSSWVATGRTPFDSTIGLDDSSTAQRRWAKWAINTALQDSETRQNADAVRLSVIDEPEMALHRAAESQMAAALSEFAADGIHALLLASHSPEVLNSQRANVVEVRPFARLFPLDPANQRSLTDLGLLPSDLLRRQRAFLLVEGQHDLIVLNVVLRDELQRLRVGILPLRGAAQLSAIKSRFLFEFTSAHLFIMLDNLNTDAVAEAWAETKERYVLDGKKAAQQVLTKSFQGRDVEERSLREFLGACIEDNQIDRVTPHGLTHGDIIEYLPVEAFVSGATSWPELREEHSSAKKRDSKTRDFKSWLRKTRKSDFSDESIISAATRLDMIPQDFVRLLKTIEAITTDHAAD